MFGRFRQFRASGPVSAAFIQDQTSLVKMLLGPVGGGKTIAAVYDSILKPCLMPVCNDGVIRYRRAIIGSTYGQIERNLYPSWKRFVPTSNGWTESDWTGGGGRFATHDVRWDIQRAGKVIPVEARYIFAAIGDNVVEEFMRGFEPTDIWLYEVDQLLEAVLDTGITRIGRFPPTGDAPDAVPKSRPFSRQIVGDLNAPDIDSWFYRRFEEGPLDLQIGSRNYQMRCYKQPSGKSPSAENLAHLPDGYYDQQIAALSARRNGANLIKRMVHAQYAPSSVGDPVYGDEYSDDVHLMPSIAPIPGARITLGFDQGLRRPACIAGQQAPNGQHLILFECVPGRMSADRFAREVKLKLAEVAPGVPLASVHYCDPAGFDGADKEGGETAWAEQVAAALDIVIEPTETNEIDPRIEAVSQELRDRIDARTPGVVFNKPHCPMLRRGFVSHYRYERVRIGNSERTKDRPEKNDESNPHDALQYYMLGLKGRHGVIHWEPSRVVDVDPRFGTRTIVSRRTAIDDDDCVTIQADVSL